MVLRSIFDDKDVIRALGMAVHFKAIRGKPPEGLMLKLKDGLGGHLKKVRLDKERSEVEKRRPCTA